MRGLRKAFAYALTTAAVSAVSVTAVSATCANSMTGTWHLHAMESDGAAIRCVANFGSNGNFNAPCKIWEHGSSTQVTTNVSGTITVSNACDVTGSVTVPGDSKVMIRYGHINGNYGSGTATQGAGGNLRTLYFSLVKQ